VAYLTWLWPPVSRRLARPHPRRIRGSRIIDDYLDELFGANIDRYTSDHLSVEASAKYDVNDNLQVFVEGKNLTDEPEYYYFGSENRLSQYDEYGARYVIGARLTY